MPEIHPNAKPALGYPSQTAAVMALRAQDIPHREIGEQLGISTDSVFSCENYGLKKLGAKKPGNRNKSMRARRPSEMNGRTVVISRDVLEDLAPDANRRGISTNALVRRIVEAVSDDGIVDAVLDDAHELAEIANGEGEK